MKIRSFPIKHSVDHFKEAMHLERTKHIITRRPWVRNTSVSYKRLSSSDIDISRTHTSIPYKQSIEPHRSIIINTIQKQKQKHGHANTIDNTRFA